MSKSDEFSKSTPKVYEICPPQFLYFFEIVTSYWDFYPMLLAELSQPPPVQPLPPLRLLSCEHQPPFKAEGRVAKSQKRTSCTCSLNGERTSPDALGRVRGPPSDPWAVSPQAVAPAVNVDNSLVEHP